MTVSMSKRTPKFRVGAGRVGRRPNRQWQGILTVQAGLRMQDGPKAKNKYPSFSPMATLHCA